VKTGTYVGRREPIAKKTFRIFLMRGKALPIGSVEATSPEDAIKVAQREFAGLTAEQKKRLSARPVAER